MNLPKCIVRALSRLRKPRQPRIERHADPAEMGTAFGLEASLAPVSRHEAPRPARGRKRDR